MDSQSWNSAHTFDIDISEAASAAGAKAGTWSCAMTDATNAIMCENGSTVVKASSSNKTCANGQWSKGEDVGNYNVRMCISGDGVPLLQVAGDELKTELIAKDLNGL